jgi:superfamily II DNA helicase RecQ
MAKIKDLSTAQMKSVKGVGEKKVEKYGKYFVPKPMTDEKG